MKRGRGPSTRSRTETTGDQLAADDRATTVVLGYVLTIGIVTILISGLLFTAGGFVKGQREQVVRSELEVVGQQVAAALASADRLAQAGSASEVVLEVNLPARAGGTAYTVEVVSDGPEYAVELRAQSMNVDVRVGVRSTTDVVTGTQIGGGNIEVAYDPGSDELEVRSARG